MELLSVPFLQKEGRKLSKTVLLLLMLALVSFVVFSITPQVAYSQASATIKGKVIDAETGKPLPRASVQIPTLRLGAVTDANGNFTFQAPPGDHTLEVRFVGYENFVRKVSLKAGETFNLEVKLSSQAIQTSEIVVVGLTGEIDRNKLGNTIASVPGKEVAKVVSSTAIDAISGRVPGVSVTRNSGTPGAGTYITMRGRKTIAGSSEPLYVVDGIIIDNTFLYDPSGTKQFGNRAIDINPQDIESIEILKGASAAAIYGSQAANGVVLITTKRGKLSSYDKPAQITFNSSYQVDAHAGKVPLQRKFGQTTPYQPGKPGTTTSYRTVTQKRLATFEYIDKDGTVKTKTDSITLAWPVPLPDTVPTYDHSKEPFRTGFTHEQSLTISGGVPQFDYLLNGTYTDTKGYVEGSTYQRSSIRANVGISLLPGVTLQTNNNFITINNDLPQDGSNTSGILLGALRTPPEFDNTKYLEPDGSPRKFAASYDNPIWTQKFNKFNSKIDRFLHSTDVKWMPLDWLSFNGRFGYDSYEYKNFERLDPKSRTTGEKGAINHQRITNKQMNLDLTATLFQKFFDDELELNLVFGSQTIWVDRSTDNVSSTSTLSFFDQIDAGATKNGSSSLLKTKTIGLFAQLTTTYLDRYSLTLSLRRDGSSTFGESKQFHYYPKAGLSYTISQEPFMKDLKPYIHNLRLRASYGEAGSPHLPYPYATNFLYVTDGTFDPWVESSLSTRGGFNGMRHSSTAGAKDIKPELNIEREIGIDIGLFDFLDIEYTFYHADIYDLILDVPVPSSTGYLTILKNAGAMWNEGFELAIRAQLFNTEDFAWNTAFMWSRNYNLVTSLNVNPDPEKNKDAFITLTGGFVSILNAAIVGQPLGVFRSAGWMRDEKGNIMYSYWDPETKSVVGDWWGRNNVGVPIADENLKVIGNPNPQFQLSWRNDFTFFRNLTLSFLFDGVFGHDVWNGTKGALYNFGTHGDTEDRDQFWYENGKPVTNYSDPDNPKPVLKQEKYQRYYNGFYINEPHIEKGSFIKLREVVLEYRWDGLRDWNINTVTLSFSARNLLTITDYKGYDPEVNTFSLAEGRGIDYFTLPQVRSYRFGISINY